MLSVNIEAVKREIDKSGIKLQAIAEKMFISRATLYNCLRGEREFSITELNALCKILSPEDPNNLMQIFLVKKLAESQQSKA